MEHFKKFLVRLQTFSINITTRKKNADTPPYNLQEVQLYNLSHENPVLSLSFKREIKELTELAVTDLLNLSPEQIRLQLRRLESIKDLFSRFWKNYYNSPMSSSDNERRNLFFSLELDDIFIVQGIEKEDYTTLFTQQFIDDLYDSVLYREEYLKEFEKAINQVLDPDNEQQSSTIFTNTKENGNGIPVIKGYAVPELFAILKDYFSFDEQENLLKLLQSGKSDAVSFTFRGNGNQLADAFKQLFDANLIVGCNKSCLESWVLKHFRYQVKGTIKNFTEKYLNDIISSNTKNCQSPILDTKKSPDGQFIVLPVQRIKKNNKKY